MNWKGCGSKRSRPNLWYYADIYLEGPRKTTKRPGQNIRSPRRDLNPGPPEYEATGRDVHFLVCIATSAAVDPFISSDQLNKSFLGICIIYYFFSVIRKQ
jgi:hypothetical protein